MRLSKRLVANLTVVSTVLAGCDTINPSEKLALNPSSVSSLKSNKAIQPLAAEAYLLLKEGKYSEASTFLNQALQSQPKSLILHLLNALTYEKLAETGDGTGLELAAVGYQNALSIDPFNIFAITQLGKIKYREKQFDQAQEYFANALLIKPNDADLIHEFAAASYYSYDIKTALASIKKAEKLKPKDPLIQRSAAMMCAAVGDFKEAEKHFKNFQAKVGQDPEVDYVANRFKDWQALYKSGRLTLAQSTAPSTTTTTTTTTAPSSTTASTSASTPSSTSSGTTSGTASSTATTTSSDGSAEDEEEGITVDTPPTSESDFPTAEEFKRGNEGANIVDVPVTPGILPSTTQGGAPGPGGPSGPGGPPAGAPPAPPIVYAAKPPPEPVTQQIIIDAYILEIAENAASFKGNNILQTLAVTLNPGSYTSYGASLWGNGALPNPTATQGDTVSNTPTTGNSIGFLFDTTGRTVPFLNTTAPAINLNNAGSITGRIFAAGINWAGLTYSLNIANAQDQRIQIVSRPTLMTYLKKESRFFSGIELVNVSGGNYGSNLSRYDVGVSLTVLPDAIVDDLVTLNIGIEQSALESPNPNLLATLDVDKTRVETTARVRLGDTILLGGMYQRQEISRKNGFPGLREVPILQYFFSNETTASIRSSIAILLTPRSPDTVKSAVNRAMTRESVKPYYCELMARNPDWFTPDANAINIFSYLSLDPVIYYEFRTNDILPPHWGYEPALTDQLGQLDAFLYF